MADDQIKLHWADFLVIGLYYVGTLAIGIWTICKTKNNLNSFFLAGRAITWWPIGMSLFASNIGSVNFVGIAGTAAASGIAVVMFEWMAIFHLVLLAWVFVPVYISSGIYTIPECLNKRFGGHRLRIYLSVIALFTYVFSIVSADLYSGALFIQHTVNLNLFIGVAIILATTVLFTTLGGLMTVVLTDTFAVMIAGGILLFIMGMIKVGSFQQLRTMYMNAVPNITSPNNTCGLPRDDSWHIFRDSVHADFPGLGMVLRTTFGAMWYWCCNQIVVQRSLAAKTIVHAKGASIFACVLKLTPIFIMVLPGMISRALYPDEVACSTPETCEQVCGNQVGCSNIAYPKLVTELLPLGLRGLLIAAMIAAVISSLTSAFNSSSSLFSVDIWQRLRPNVTEKELVIAGKVFVALLTAASVIWIPIMQNAEGGQIYRYTAATTGLFGGPTCALFLLAVFCRRTTEQGAFWGLICGQVWGVVRFVMDVIYPAPSCGFDDTRPAFLKYWHVYYHIMSQVIITFVISLLVSCFTKPIPKRMLHGLTFWTYKMKPEEDLTYRQLDGTSTDKETEMILMKSEEDTVKTDTIDHPAVKMFTCSTSKHSVCGQIMSALFIGDEDICAQKNDENYEDVDVRLESLKEPPIWKSFLNVSAFLMMSFTTGLYVYFR